MVISLLFTGIQYIRDDSFYNESLLNSKVFRKNQLKYRDYTGKWINCINVEFRAGMEKSNNAGKWLGKKRIKKFVKNAVLTVSTLMMQWVTKKWNSQTQGLKPPHKEYKEFSDLFIYPGEYHFFVQW